MTITRRDFLNGMALGIAAGLTPLQQIAAATRAALGTYIPGDDYYPPGLTGLRGSHDGSFETAHLLGRDGVRFKLPEHIEEDYDLVVAGAGISGLAAALYYRQKWGPDTKILLLDNHDDFGGHAKRNEFETGKGTLLTYGGSESLQSPHSIYSKVAMDYINAIGIDLKQLEDHFDVNFYPDMGLSKGVFFDKKHFGVSKVVAGDPGREVADDIPFGRENGRSYEEFIGDFPLPEDDRERMIRLFKGEVHYLADMTPDEQVEYLETHSYAEFLRDKVGLSKMGVLFFQQQTHDFLAMGIDAMPALDGQACSLPGFDRLDIAPLEPEYQAEIDDPYIHHFPDGNASIARLTVRKLIPEAAPGDDMLDIVQARFDYSQLDRPEHNTRIRLNSTVVHARNNEDGHTEVVYVRGDSTHKVRARHCVLACYNMMIPYMVPDLPQEQKDALALNVKAPLVYTKVALSNWQPFVKLGVHKIYSPAAHYSTVKLDYPVSMGGYQHAKTPDDPVVLHMIYVPTMPGSRLPPRRQSAMGRAHLLGMTFDDHEQMIRNQLQEMLGPAGFRQQDILGITVNRWSHGYAYIPSSLFDDEDELEELVELSRQPFGNIHIANSDAGMDAYAHVAIEQAFRAIEEISASLEGGSRA